MNEPAILVSGLPRSGTSMIMQMLAAGGVEILSDGQRRADDDNPRGYFELEAVKTTGTDASWRDQAPGKGIKLISQLLYELPAGTRADVIVLRRDMAEILASQRKMLERAGGRIAAPDAALAEDEQMGRIFTSHLTDVLAWVQQRQGLKLLEVWHADVLRDAAAAAAKMQVFLGRGLDVTAMAAVVDGGLHRNRGETGASGLRS